ncbi:hypothetical protein BBJ28_00018546 [Nothophytophthora sp. Chile5]|nr:hypothetical protein BBJ28_00018546 [Nothophytophthora sp. Chile5]
MKVLCVSSPFGRPPTTETLQMKEPLTQFYAENYKPMMLDTLSYRHLNTVLDYMAIEIITMYENNIKQHYCDQVPAEQKKAQTNLLCRELRKVKNDILGVNSPNTSDPQYHKWIDEQRPRVMPQGVLAKNSVYYDIQCTPQDYLTKMVYMMKAVEASGNTISSVFPLRSQLIPKHFRLDTTSLVFLLFTNQNGKRTAITRDGNLKKMQSDVWGYFFKTNMKCFHRMKDDHSYTFHHMIETDGVRCSIKGGGEKYIDEIGEEERESLAEKKLVGIDPNMGDLLYCVDSDQPDQTKFRYSQDTRRKETKFKKYRNLLQSMKRDVVDGRRVVEWEADMSAYNKNALNMRLAPFYNKYLFRKLRLGSYSRRQITEARLLKRFELLFGSSEQVVVCVGDWEQTQHRKFKEPVKGKGFRTLFRKAGFQVYLMDEFRISCRFDKSNLQQS